MATNPCKGMEAMVRMIVGRMHVGDSDDEVKAYVVSRLKKGAAPKLVKQAERCAVKLHRVNQKMYSKVMRGRF